MALSSIKIIPFFGGFPIVVLNRLLYFHQKASLRLDNNLLEISALFNIKVP
jgi:hypothetical protein